MALTLRELYNEMRERFHLECLASNNDALDHVVTWVHLAEDVSIADFFWGNELLVTTGYGAKDATGLLRMAQRLNEKKCSGLVINLGKYFTEAPEEVVQFCEKNRMPLFAMPWEFSVTAFVRACCSRIDESSHDMDRLARAVINIILSPNAAGSYTARLLDYFDNDAGYQMLVVFVEVPDSDRRLGIHRAELRFHTALNKWGFQYLVFTYEQRFVLLLNQKDTAVTEEIARTVLDTYRATYGYEEENPRISIGIGSPVADVTKLDAAYYSAVSAVRRAQLTHTDLVLFRDMGFYKLLYSIPDDTLMLDYYHEVMGPLLEHDRRHGSNYKETLFRYLLHDGSLQAVADEMYTHRNTVNYRMGRIRELLGNPLATHSDCLPYLLAYHIAVILKVQDDYEA